MSATPPRIDIAAQAVEPALLEGGPILVIIELRVVTSALRAHVSGVAEPSLLSLSGIGAAWSSNQEARQVVLPALPDPEWAPVRDLDSTESRRTVVDLSPLVRGAKPGALALQVLAATPFGRVASAALSLSVEVATGPAAAILRTAREELGAGQGWVDWARGDAESALDQRPLAELGPLAFHGLVRRWRRASHSIDPGELAALGPRLLPEHLGFLAERARLMGSRLELAQRIAEVRAVAPGLGWWMDDLAHGNRTWTGATLPSRVEF